MEQICQFPEFHRFMWPLQVDLESILYIILIILYICTFIQAWACHFISSICPLCFLLCIPGSVITGPEKSDAANWPIPSAMTIANDPSKFRTILVWLCPFCQGSDHCMLSGCQVNCNTSKVLEFWRRHIVLLRNPQSRAWRLSNTNAWSGQTLIWYTKITKRESIHFRCSSLKGKFIAKRCTNMHSESILLFLFIIQVPVCSFCISGLCNWIQSVPKSYRNCWLSTNTLRKL